VEILVVVLILAILMAVALPLYLSAIRSSARQTAQANLQTIINAEQAHRLGRTHQYAAHLSDMIGPGLEFNQNIVGPGQTQYTVHVGGETLPNGCVVPVGGVAACAQDPTLGAEGAYGCLIPGGAVQDQTNGCSASETGNGG
jgi:competence protein ComGC